MALAPTCLALASLPVAAEHAAQHASELDYFQDLPVVLSVTRLAQPLGEVPGAVTVIDRETIRRSGAREVAEVLRLVPGFLVTRRNGGNTIASYHSALDIYGARMQVYVDGRSVYSSFFLGDTHRGLAAIDLAQVERIEVLRGSNSAAFGSNAFLGVVNIITRAPADTHGRSVSLARGDSGIDDNHLSIGWGGDVADLRVSVSRRATTGYAFVYDDSRRSQLQFRGDFRVTPSDDVSVKAGVASESFGEGYPPKACTTLLGPGTCDDNKERTDFWRNSFLRFDWTRSLDAKSALRLAGGVDQEDYDSAFFAEQYPNAAPIRIFAPLNFSGRAQRQNLEIQRTDIWNDSLRTMVGVEALREEVHAPFLYSTQAKISASQLRIFGGIEWRPVADWIINTGGMWEKHSVTGSTFAPRLAVNHILLPNHNLRWVATQSVRTPSIYMLRGRSDLIVSSAPLLPPFPRAVPFAATTGTVRPETLVSNEIGYVGTFPGLALKLDGRGFVERMNQRIWVEGLDFVNRPGPTIHGFEYQLDWKPFDGTQIVFSEAHLREKRGREATTEQFEAPQRTGSLAFYQKLPHGFDLSLITHYSTPYQWAGPDQVLEGMRQLDARIAYSFKAGATRGEMAVTVQSVGGSHMEYLRSQRFGRRAIASLRLDF